MMIRTHLIRIGQQKQQRLRRQGFVVLHELSSKSGNDSSHKKNVEIDVLFRALRGEKPGSPQAESLEANTRQASKRSKEKLAGSTKNKNKNRPKPMSQDMAKFFRDVDLLLGKNPGKQKRQSKEKTKSSDLQPQRANTQQQPRNEQTTFTEFAGDPAAPSDSISSKSNNYDNSGTEMVADNDSNILDLFQLPKPPNPNQFDDDSYQEYMQILSTIINGSKFTRPGKSIREPVIEWLTAKEPVVPYTFPALEEANRCDNKTKSESFQHQIALQQEKFSSHYSKWTRKQLELASGALKQVANLCAKQATPTRALEVAWEKIKECGQLSDKSLLHTCLYVASTFSANPNSTATLSSSPTVANSGSVLEFLGIDAVSIGATSQQSTEHPHHSSNFSIQNNHNDNDLAAEVAVVHDLLFETTEQSTCVRIRVLVSQGNPKAAEEILNQFPNETDLKLRTYMPIYRSYIDVKDVSSAIRLYLKMKHESRVALQPEICVQLLACVAENGYLCHDAVPIPELDSLGLKNVCGPKLFNELATELADDTIEISAASAKRLYNAIAQGFCMSHHGTVVNNLKPLHVLEPLTVNNVFCDEDNELIVSRVQVNESNGRCPRTGVSLRLLHLDPIQREQLRDGLLFLSDEAYEQRYKKKTNEARKKLEMFGAWLDDREGRPFTAIVDGANVAYYMQNFDGGSFNFHQIKFMVDALERMKENVLVVLPSKYARDEFTVNIMSESRTQSLSKKEMALRDELIRSGKLFIVPSQFLDDLYWMYASVSNQSNSRQGSDLTVLPNNPDGRWPGNRPVLISNDKMRDHKLALLEPRLFRRWYSNFIVNFTFSAFVGGVCVDKEIGFRTADFYSREIQSNPLMRKSINGESIVDTVWHFPVKDWDENECLCIRIPCPHR